MLRLRWQNLPASLRWGRIHGCERRLYVVLPSMRFQHIIDDVGATFAAYESDPLSLVAPARRGRLLESLAKRVLERLHANCYFQDAPQNSACADGQPRGLWRADFDGTFRGRRVEIKSARLSWSSGDRVWRYTFYNVKLARDGFVHQPFDELYLLTHAPDGFCLIKHDLSTRVYSSGIRTEIHGHMIRIPGSCDDCSWKEAQKTILHKLLSEGSCELLSHVSLSDPLIRSMYSQLTSDKLPPHYELYKGITWSTLDPCRRGLCVEQIAFEFDQMQNPSSTFLSAKGEMTAQGYHRSERNAAVDWIRNGVRVEVKHTQMQTYRQAFWRCQWSGIKAPSLGCSHGTYFDELWLAIYSPRGLHFFKHWGWHDNLISQGARSSSQGGVLQISVKVKDFCIDHAIQDITSKLVDRGAEPHMTILWDS